MCVCVYVFVCVCVCVCTCFVNICSQFPACAVALTHIISLSFAQIHLFANGWQESKYAMTRAHTHTLALSFSLSLTHSITHPHTHAHTRTHTQTRTPSLLSLPLSHSFPPPSIPLSLPSHSSLLPFRFHIFPHTHTHTHTHPTHIHKFTHNKQLPDWLVREQVRRDVHRDQQRKQVKVCTYIECMYIHILIYIYLRVHKHTCLEICVCE